MTTELASQEADFVAEYFQENLGKSLEGANKEFFVENATDTHPRRISVKKADTSQMFYVKRVRVQAGGWIAAGEATSEQFQQATEVDLTLYV